LEITGQKLPWLNENHPNYKRWKRARKLSIARGSFVKSIIEKTITPEGIKVLDIGSGEGGTAKVLSENNFVVSSDLSKTRLQRQQQFNLTFARVCCNINSLPFKKASFNLIILQDVIEHLQNANNLPDKLYSLLEHDGVIYLSTPNRFSLFNIISDPHWGLPLLSLFRRKTIKRYFLTLFRKDDVIRNDVAELFSLHKIEKLFSQKFELKLFTNHSVSELFNGNEGIVWSDFHIKLIRILRNLKLDKLVKKIANDKKGFINNFFTPTFYLILKKK